MGRYVRITREIERVVTIDGRQAVLRLDPEKMTIRMLGSRRKSAVPITWAELAREGGSLDQAELSRRPLLGKFLGVGAQTKVGV